MKKGDENARGSKRPKDRKKRGRDVYKEVLEQERKKSASSSAPSTSQHPSRSTSLLQVQTTSGSEADASRSRSRSSSRALSHSRSISKSRSRSRLRPTYEEDGVTEDTPKPDMRTQPKNVESFKFGAPPTMTQRVHNVDGKGDRSSPSLLDSIVFFAGAEL